MGSNEGRVWVSLGGVGHVDLSGGFFGLTMGFSIIWENLVKSFALLVKWLY